MTWPSDSNHQIQRRLAKGGYRVHRAHLRNDCGFGRNTEDTHACLTERGRGEGSREQGEQTLSCAWSMGMGTSPALPGRLTGAE
ncbi:hypothetical protein H6G64_34050 [Calothrix sp. FACHB-156]|nr:hypothetical protein [Calothrix sp. FACHB-156]